MCRVNHKSPTTWVPLHPEEITRGASHTTVTFYTFLSLNFSNSVHIVIHKMYVPTRLMHALKTLIFTVLEKNE